MKIPKIAGLALAIFISACGKHVDVPSATYVAELKDESLISNISDRVLFVAESWDVEVIVKDRETQTRLSGGKPSFFIAYLVEGNAILVVENLGPSDFVRVTVSEFGEFSEKKLHILAETVLTELEQLGLKFSIVDGPSSGQSQN